MNPDPVKLLALWALIHETADEGWKAAVSRGSAEGSKGMEAGPEAFVDGLAALISKEKERLKASLASKPAAEAPQGEERGVPAEELRFELGQIRARLETLESSLEALLRRLDTPRQPRSAERG